MFKWFKKLTLVINDNDSKAQTDDTNIENLRIQYQVCQQAANNETMGYWAFAGIFLGLSTVLLGAVVNSLFNLQTHEPHFRIIVALLTLGMWIIYLALYLMLERVNRRQRGFLNRMGEIEKKTNMNVLQRDIPGIRGETLYGAILAILAAFWLAVLIIALL